LPGGERLIQFQKKYEEDKGEHDASLARFVATILEQVSIAANGISVANLRDIASAIKGPMSNELRAQHVSIASLKKSWEDMHGPGLSEG